MDLFVQEKKQLIYKLQSYHEYNSLKMSCYKRLAENCLHHHFSGLLNNLQTNLKPKTADEIAELYFSDIRDPNGCKSRL
jgi:hypothetical protein